MSLMKAALFLMILHMLFPAASGAVAASDTMADVEVRWIARHIYEDLNRPSCSAPPGFNRTARLGEARAAVTAFEARAAGTGLAFPLAVAQADAAYEQVSVGGCWVDDDIDFAEKHLEMTRETVEDGLRMLTPYLTGSPSSTVATVSAEHGAAFRSGVRDLARTVRPMCRLTSRVDNDVIVAAAQAEVARFRQRIEGTPWALHYDIAEGDVVYWSRRVMVDCAAPGATAPEAESAELLADARRRIAALESEIQAH